MPKVVHVRTGADTGIRPIIPWSGSIGSIPAGWDFCDGTNGTPDTRDRMILGAAFPGVVSLGGAPQPLSLTHNHRYTLTPGHIAVVNESAHTHTVTSASLPNTIASGVSGIGITALLRQRMPHAHGMTSASVSATQPHSHPLSGTQTEDDTQLLDFRQPFKALAYMKSRHLVELPLYGIAAVDASARPANYQLCDGSGITPNLIQRFVFGPGAYLGAGAQNSDPVTVDYSHDHSAAGFTLAAATHQHDYTGALGAAYDTPLAPPNADGTSAGVGAAMLGGHRHTLELHTDSTLHGHSISGNVDFDGITFDTVPLVLVVAYVMRVS